MGKVATVKLGPSAWLTKSGPVTRETDDFIWVNLESKDDAKDGNKIYEVVMPKAMVTVEDAAETS